MTRSYHRARRPIRPFVQLWHPRVVRWVLIETEDGYAVQVALQPFCGVPHYYTYVRKQTGRAPEALRF